MILKNEITKKQVSIILNHRGDYEVKSLDCPRLSWTFSSETSAHSCAKELLKLLN
jgi:hypothetical protein